MDRDKEGNPTWESCLNHTFSFYYPTMAVAETF